MTAMLPTPLAAGVFPIGTVIASAATLNQAQLQQQGWLYCDGAAVSRSDYSDLFGVIGIGFGSGDGVSTFDLPDCRGYFARGADNGAGVDPDAASRTSSAPGGNTGTLVGSAQGYATQAPATNGFVAAMTGSHSHSIPHLPVHRSSSAIKGNYQDVWNEDTEQTQPAGLHSHNLPSGGDAETVPVNNNTYYVIKFKDVS